MSLVIRLWGKKPSSTKVAKRITQSQKQRQLTRWDKYRTWGKAWHKWFPIQEKTPQCISSRHLTRSSPSLLHPSASARTTRIILYQVQRGGGWGWRLKKREEDSLHLWFFFPNIHHAYPHTEFKVPVSSVSTPHHHFAYCGNLSRVNWPGFLWFSKMFSQGIFSTRLNVYELSAYYVPPRWVRHIAFQTVQLEVSFHD